MDYPDKVFITLFLSPKRYNLLNDIINYTFSGVFSFFIRIFVPRKGIKQIKHEQYIIIIRQGNAQAIRIDTSRSGSEIGRRTQIRKRTGTGKGNIKTR